MAIPMAGGEMANLIRTYREAWRGAGHAGDGRVEERLAAVLDGEGLECHILWHEQRPLERLSLRPGGAGG